MPNILTGEFDVVVQFGIPALNRILAAQHQEEMYLHSLPVGIDDAETGMQGIATVQVSTPTITLPEDGSGSKIHRLLSDYGSGNASKCRITRVHSRRATSYR